MKNIFYSFPKKNQAYCFFIIYFLLFSDATEKARVRTATPIPNSFFCFTPYKKITNRGRIMVKSIKIFIPFKHNTKKVFFLHLLPLKFIKNRKNSSPFTSFTIFFCGMVKKCFITASVCVVLKFQKFLKYDMKDINT